MFQAAGIYILRSFQQPDRIYVGSSINLAARKNRHFWELATFRHPNSKLQRHALKYGLADLVFEILCFCHPEELLKIEQFLIDDLHPFFNINPVAGSRLGSQQSSITKSLISAWSAKVHRLSFATSLFKHAKN